MTDDTVITWEWTHEERRCTCTPEHRPLCHLCGGTGIVRLARLRRVAGFDGVVVNPPFQASEGEGVEE